MPNLIGSLLEAASALLDSTFEDTFAECTVAVRNVVIYGPAGSGSFIIRKLTDQ